MNSNFLIFGASGLIGGHFKEACENNEKEFISIGRRHLPKLDINKQRIIRKGYFVINCQDYVLGISLSSYVLINFPFAADSRIYHI